MSTYFVSGRSLANWRAKGHTPPADAVGAQCAFCHDRITLSPEGAAKLVALPAQGHAAVPICTTCSMLVVATARPVEIQTSEYAAEQVRRSPDAKATLDALRELAHEKRGEGPE